ncbi:MAG: tRNA pseudouridine(13) synthase TruD [Planctomycetota bacterium]|nr:MAG: tRNA pseudouridine(13) synthase TruD [Planctomycetota bacterium]
MRLKRIQDDFRVFEVLDEKALLGPGPFTLYRVTKRGLTTLEAVDVLAREAGVDRSAVAYAGFKDKDGVTGQFMTVEGGRPVQYKDRRLTLRGIGSARRAVRSDDNLGNSFEIVVRELAAADMARIRRNLAVVRRQGMPAYFDDQRFGCLRHGQGYIVRQLLRGDAEGALRSLMCAPSRYGHEKVERFKEGIRRRWGDWDELASYCRGRRGESLFAHLRDEPDDFVGALVRGISTRERTIHLFAWQSHLWNRAAALWVRSVAPEDSIGWLPCDEGPLPVPRELPPAELRRLQAAKLPLFGQGVELGPEAERFYRAVFRAEGVDPEAFLSLDIPGFRPLGEERDLYMLPQHLRAAPAERDDVCRKGHKMRLRFTLPRGRYATLVAKRLALPESENDPPPRLYVSRHRLDFPDAEGRMPDEDVKVWRDEERRWQAKRHEQKKERAGGGRGRPSPWRDGGKPGRRRAGGPDDRSGWKPGGKPGSGSGRGGKGGRSGRPGGSKPDWKKKGPGGPRAGGGSSPASGPRPGWGSQWKKQKEDEA